MNKSRISRRSFLRSTMIGSGAVIAYTVAGNTLSAASSSTKINYTTKKAKGGCYKCETEISRMLKDRTMQKKLNSLFPENSKVYFYVRRHSKQVFPKGTHIAVGNCARALKDSADLFIPGCGRLITSDSIFRAIVKKFKN